MDIQSDFIPLSMGTLAWITTFEIPIIMAIIAYAHRAKIHLENRVQHISDTTHEDVEDLRNALLQYKLEVAQKYASMGYLRDVESRLTNHLIRIEKKLDGQITHGA